MCNKVSGRGYSGGKRTVFFLPCTGAGRSMEAYKAFAIEGRGGWIFRAAVHLGDNLIFYSFSLLLISFLKGHTARQLQ